MLISLQNLGKSFGDTVVLHDINATVEKGERIGIVGENGAGKTTLLKVLCGEYLPDEGEYQISRGVTLGYLEQNSKLDPTLDVYGEMRSAFAPVLSAMEQMQVLENKLEKNPGDAQLLAKHAELSAVIDAADGYHMDIQIKKVLSGMAFGPETYTKGVSVLSGGEHTRLRLAKLLLQRPDLLILDEPTNHLDVDAKEELKRALKEYKGAVLLICHEPEFYDGLVSKVWNLGEYSLKI